MATRPLSELSPAYRRRIERAMAQGKTRQGARGHKAQEHVARKKRELTLNQLTTSQRQQVRKFARKQSDRAGEDYEEYADTMLELGTVRGYDWFRGVRDWVTRANREYKQEMSEGSYVSRGIEWLRGEAAEKHLDDVGWLFYH